MSSYKPDNALGFFLDPSIRFPEDEFEFKRVLRDAYYQTALCVNGRVIAIFPLNEIISGKSYYTVGNPQKFRSVYRKCFNITNSVPLAPGATSTTAHGIANIVEFPLIQADCVTNVPDYRVIPYASATDVTKQIEILIDNTNIYIINGANSPTLNKISVVLETLKTN
jgi:hypothetical protein